MNKQQFLSYINNPSSLHSKDINQLKELIDKFPYCQTSHLLLTKCYYNSDNINYDSQLKTAAAYASDRKVIHAVIKSDIESKPVAKTSPIIKKSVERKIESIEKVEKKEEPKVEIPKKATKRESKPLLSKTDVKPVLQTEETKSSPLVKVKKDEEKTEQILDITEGKHSFTSWLQKLESAPKTEKKVTQGVEKKDKEKNKPGEILKIDNPSELEKLYMEGIYSAGVMEETGADKNKDDEDELKKTASDFNQKGLEKSTYFFSVEKIAESSLQENDDIISETLAKIYLQQDNPVKAIETYQKLSLKFPEKSGYFASLIEEIEKSSDQ